MGSVVNTNAAWIGDRLFEHGVRLARQTAVPDGDAIFEVMRAAAFRSSIVIVTGGLGPTSDDVTREALAKLCGVDFVPDAGVEKLLRDFFEKRGRNMALSNIKQAMVPDGARVLPNGFGTAPGLWMPACPESGRGDVILLPGPPREMKPMLERYVLPALDERRRGMLKAIQVLKVIGMGESDLQDMVDNQLQRIDGLEYGYCARLGEVDIRLIGDDAVRKQAVHVLESLIPDYILKPYGFKLEEVVIRMFLEKRLKLAVAESCTGGLIAKRLTDISGASAVFEYGFVTYANRAKEQLLGVPHVLLERYGAVSEQVACAMAKGALAVSGSDVAVAVTGVAGPTGGTEAKPVGTVWMAWAFKDGAVESKKAFFPTDRDAFRHLVAQHVFYRLTKI